MDNIIVEGEAFEDAFARIDEGNRSCEACHMGMWLHDWAAFDPNGFVVNCSIQQKHYGYKLFDPDWSEYEHEED